MVEPLPNVFTDPHTFQPIYKCEYLVVGTGPGGSVAGGLLSENGKDVIFIEEGGFYPSQARSTNIGHMTALFYRDSGIFPFLGSPTVAFAEGCCVGGGSIINGALLWRTPPWVLDEWKTTYGLEGYSEKDLADHFKFIESRLNVVRHTMEKSANLDSKALVKGADNLGWKFVMVPRAVKNCTNENLCPTGCPSGAKQTMLETYLSRAFKNGARLFANLKVKRIKWSGKRAVSVVAESSNNCGAKPAIFYFDKLILAGGAIQTPHLLKRSKCSKLAGNQLEFHMNLKIVARFNKPIYGEKGTMFTVQVQEFAEEGILFMASNMRPQYLTTALSHFDNDIINRVLKNYPFYGIYVAMIRPRSKARIVSCAGERPLVYYRFNPADTFLIRKTLRLAAELLFASGAIELYMPISGTQPISSLQHFDNIIDRISPKNFEIISVHAMASCPMGNENRESVVDLTGRLKDFENVYITDASILPSNIGESPQGTIMAFAHEIIRRHLAE